MTDLVVFLRARFDDEERVAREAERYSPSPWTAADSAISGGTVCCDHDPMHSDPDEVDTYVAGCEHRHDADFIARWDPARVLAEVAAKRALLDLYDMHDECHEHADQDQARAIMAVPYAAHPDYDPQWRQWITASGL